MIVSPRKSKKKHGENQSQSIMWRSLISYLVSVFVNIEIPLLVLEKIVVSVHLYLNISCTVSSFDRDFSNTRICLLLKSHLTLLVLCIYTLITFVKAKTVQWPQTQ